MIAANAMANILPVGRITTGEVSDFFPDLFAPAPLTFSIWAVIYLLLGGYVLYQFGIFKKIEKTSVLEKISPYFIISSLANTMWIFAWHYKLIFLSLILMIVILYCLIKIADVLKNELFDITGKFFVKAPFTIYFGWITVATIANITTFLVSIRWHGFGLEEYIWTVIILIVGSIIGISRMVLDKNIVYGFVFLWAYLGILIKHLTTFDSQYPAIIIAVSIAMLAFLMAKVFVFSKNKEVF